MAFSFLHTGNYLRVLGIMNGTSLDGVDFVLTKIQKKNLNTTFLKLKSFPFSRELQKKLAQAASHQMTVNELALLHHELGRFYASCYNKLKFGKIELIGLHGQTVFHQGKIATLQIGEASYLAAASKCPVVSDFRVADIAVGGQGAPIATFFHQILFGRIQKKLSLHNLGGISNLTLIKNGKVVQGFDTGPANMLMDLEIQRASFGKKKFDRGGLTAKLGKANLDLVNKMLKHPYFRKKAPKSCGREEFGIQFLEKYDQELKDLSLNDRLATLTEFVAQSIVLSYKKLSDFIPQEIIFCGGGVYNTHLLKTIEKLLPLVRIQSVEDYGWPAKSIEAAAFAVLAAAKVLNIPSNMPLSTGAKKKISLGKITHI